MSPTEELRHSSRKAGDIYLGTSYSTAVMPPSLLHRTDTANATAPCSLLTEQQRGTPNSQGKAQVRQQRRDA
ncbi:hypothetical protein NDU88_006031 [Pleurodeles waltl]|uniref:Uncharacterized protein n=1 Tax=Pleurodeles waltl TaxID=8319 RepID=A0AAV7X003_PLEWA|nr:hypothetical protein NDU88_006031 [Pleurodeles waltl]